MLKEIEQAPQESHTGYSRPVRRRWEQNNPLVLAKGSSPGLFLHSRVVRNLLFHKIRLATWRRGVYVGMCKSAAEEWLDTADCPIKYPGDHRRSSEMWGTGAALLQHKTHVLCCSVVLCIILTLVVQNQASLDIIIGSAKRSNSRGQPVTSPEEEKKRRPHLRHRTLPTHMTSRTTQWWIKASGPRDWDDC